MKNAFKMIAAFLTPVVTLSSVTPYCVFGAADEMYTDEIKYALSVIDDLLENNDISLEGKRLSNKFNFYNLKTEQLLDNGLYFVFDDQTIIGRLAVTKYNGEFYSSFSCTTSEVMQNLYEQHTAFQLCTNDEAPPAIIFDGKELTPEFPPKDNYHFYENAPLSYTLQEIKPIYPIYEATEKIFHGDANEDGIPYDLSDAQLVLSDYINQLVGTADNIVDVSIADMDGDKIITVSDAQLILLEYVNKMIQ